MGLVGQAAAVSDAGQATIDAEDFDTLALSPASVLHHHDLNIPSASFHHDPLQTPRFLKRCSSFGDSTVLPSEPGAVGHVATCSLPTTPLPDEPIPRYPSMNVIVGGALAPMHASPPRRQHETPSPGLRLPSFEALGIAAPHPDRFGGLGFTFDAMKDAGEEPAADSRLLPAFNTPQISPANLKHPLDPNIALVGSRTIATIRHDVATLTPPAETGDIQYNPITALSGAPMDLPASDASSTGSLPPHNTEQNPVDSPPDSREGADPTRPRSWFAGALNAVCK